MTTPRLPRQLTTKYDELLRERSEIAIRIGKLDEELAALEYAMRVVDPGWEPPTRARKKQRSSRLPPGSLSRDCLAILRESGELWTPEIVERIAQRRRVHFVNNRDRQDFASAVAMALRRYERQGFLETIEQDSRTRAIKWRISGNVTAEDDSQHRLRVVP